MQIDLTPILTAVVGLCAAIITYVVVPWIKSKTTQQKREDLLAWAKVAVAAAEQLYGSEYAAEKKKEAIDFLTAKGFNVNEDELNAAIEAAVNELHSKMNDK